MTPHPFAGRTPEALVGRNDSKNPATTCRGITNSGRPCRRAIASSKLRAGGVVALVEDDDGAVEDASYYCHDHKAQAETLAQPAAPGTKKTELFPLKERNSVDTLVQRLGVEGVGSEISAKVRRKKDDGRRRPGKTQEAPYAEKYGLGQTEGNNGKKEKSSFWSALCCMGGGKEDDYIEIVRHKKRVEDSRPSNAKPRPSASANTRPASSSKRPSRPTSELPIRPATHHAASNSQTGNLLSLIPQSLSPTTTSALLTELGKPHNPNDEEGYIYIFWLTPQQSKVPDTTTARSLLSSESHTRRERRISDVVSEFSYTADEPRSINTKGRARNTILLKIGRANNVTRRMNEWQRQCGYALTLVRWYPYVSSSAAPSPAPSSPARSPNRQSPAYPDLSQPASASRPGPGRRESSGLVKKVPCVKRVERLIHLELAERRVMKDCEACGRKHQEWFEVDGSEKGVRGVDEVVRRWVAWGERQAG